MAAAIAAVRKWPMDRSLGIGVSGAGWWEELRNAGGTSYYTASAVMVDAALVWSMYQLCQRMVVLWSQEITKVFCGMRKARRRPFRSEGCWVRRR